MKLAPDKIVHLKAGGLVAAFLAILVFISVYFGLGYAVAFGAIGIGAGLEIYQGYRKEGVPSFWDAVASALPGVALGLGYELWKFLA